MRIRNLLMIFSVVFIVFHLVPFFLDYQFKLTLPLLGDFVDLLTPFLLILLYFLIYVELNRKKHFIFPSRWVIGAFVAGAVFLVSGHGMHLAANSVARLLEYAPTSSVYALNYFFDETLGHIWWHVGILILSLGAIILQLKIPYDNEPKIAIIIPAVLYAITLAVISIEGQTTYLMLPASLLIGIGLHYFIKKRKLKEKQPIVFYFYYGYLITAVLMIIYGIVFKGFPQIVGTLI